MPVQDLTQRSLGELTSLDGQVAVVTGGARGIGFAISRRFAEAGAHVVIGDIDEVAAKEAADRLLALGYGASGFHLDATDLREIGELADVAIREHGRLDIWVNNAGIYPMAPVMDMTEDDYDEVIDLNLKGTFFGAREAAKRMQDGGVIINLASTAGFRGYPNASHYVASKHGVRGVTRSLAAEFGPLGIRVMALAPTLIETPGIEEARPLMDELGMGDMFDQIAEMLPLGRAGVPDDVARVALFCASDLAGFLTGSTIPVDGGNLAV